TGFAPEDFFIRLKIQRACEILEATDLCVKEVAAKLGYDDAFYFSRLFKSVNGVAPTEYRRLADSQKRALRSEMLPDRRTGEFGASPPKAIGNWVDFSPRESSSSPCVMINSAKPERK